MIEDQKNDQTQSANFRADEKGDGSSSQTPFPQFNNPQFGNPASMPFEGDITRRIEAAKSNGWGAQLSAFISERKKPIAVAVIAILLFVGGTYLSRNSAENTPAGLNDLDNTEENKLDTEVDTNVDNELDLDSKTPPKEINLELNEDGQIIAEVGPALPKEEPAPKESRPENAKTGAAVIVEKISDTITMKAEKGDGITHLARHAIKEYLAEKKEALTPEQKIYAEDYIQNRTGSNFLEIGQKLSFSKDLIKEAVEKSKALEGWQINNLKKYTANISL